MQIRFDFDENGKTDKRYQIVNDDRFSIDLIYSSDQEYEGFYTLLYSKLQEENSDEMISKFEELSTANSFEEIERYLEIYGYEKYEYEFDDLYEWYKKYKVLHKHSKVPLIKRIKGLFVLQKMYLNEQELSTDEWIEKIKQNKVLDTLYLEKNFASSEEIKEKCINLVNENKLADLSYLTQDYNSEYEYHYLQYNSCAICDSYRPSIQEIADEIANEILAPDTEFIENWEQMKDGVEYGLDELLPYSLNIKNEDDE